MAILPTLNPLTAACRTYSDRIISSNQEVAMLAAIRVWCQTYHYEHEMIGTALRHRRLTVHPKTDRERLAKKGTFNSESVAERRRAIQIGGEYLCQLRKAQDVPPEEKVKVLRNSAPPGISTPGWALRSKNDSGQNSAGGGMPPDMKDHSGL